MGKIKVRSGEQLDKSYAQLIDATHELLDFLKEKDEELYKEVWNFYHQKGLDFFMAVPIDEK